MRSVSDNRPINYILIGMAGVGKTTLGQKLARRLNYNFVDTDKIIEAAYAHKPLQSILDEFIANDNIRGFIAEERRIFRETKPYKHTVIATGGSFCYSPELLKLHKGIVIYLEISWEVLKTRLGSFADRGLVQLAPSLHEEYLLRVPLYKRFSHAKISCDHKSSSELVMEISNTTFKKS